ncbi:MAG TPA: hypothetical protein VEH06_15650 [Candidatus Bathyarchaeia archaeon]|nr:hypothetical protein [Candidatus Bathyarchaeia archaeon]
MKKTEKENDSPGSTALLKRVRISYLLTSSLVIVFAVSYGYLEYYYINDPVLGKTANLTVKGGTHRVATPIIGGLYSYHIYPMMVIFILVGFGPFFDSVSFNILGRHERRKAAALGVANVITAMLVEDFTWFFYRWWLPLDNDPKKGLLIQASDWTTKSLGSLPIPHIHPFGSFVIPYWYIVSIVIAGIFYYYAFKKSKQKIPTESSHFR